MTTLKITVGERDRLDERTRRRIEAAEEGVALEDDQPLLNVESYDELGRLLSPKNLELLEVIAQHSPASIQETAELVERDYKQVHRNLGELEDLGVLQFSGGDPGQSKTPELAYDGLEIDLPFTNLVGRGGGAGAADAD